MTERRRALLIENPAASKSSKSALRVAERALASVFDLSVETTSAPGHAEQLATTATQSGFDTILCYGGDGTVHEAINGLLSAGSPTSVVLGVLPGGGTNVMARRLGYPNDLIPATERLCDKASESRVKSLGCGLLEFNDTSRYFVFNAGLGFDAEMVRMTNAARVPSKLRDPWFVINGFRAFSRMRNHGEPTILLDGQHAWWVILSCGDPYTYLGRRGFRVTPHASGKGIDVVAGKSVSYGRTLRWIMQCFVGGRHLKHPDLIYRPNEALVELKASPATGLQADGEYLGAVDHVVARFQPAALTFWA